MTISVMRKQAGLSQAELAEKVGVTQGEISRIERGLQIPRPKLMKRLKKVLGGDLLTEAIAVVVGEELFVAFDKQGNQIGPISERQKSKAISGKERSDGYGLSIPAEMVREERGFWAKTRLLDDYVFQARNKEGR